MASLTGQQIKETYKSLLKTEDNGQISNVSKNITDGSGSASGLYLRNNGVLLSGSVVISGSLLYSGSALNIQVLSSSYALTASLATTASHALNARTASYALNAGSSPFPFSGSASITGSLSIKGTIELSYLISGSLIGPSSSFTKPDYSSSVQDTISDGLVIARANNRGIYNSVLEAEYDNNTYTSPLGTRWNSIHTDQVNYGWNNLRDVQDRTYDTWVEAVNYQPVENIGQELIMHDTTEDQYYAVKFLSWTSGSAGGGFSYERSLIQKVTDGITFPDGTNQTTAFPNQLSAIKVVNGNTLYFTGSSGNALVGINTSNPNYTLDVNGSVGITNGNLIVNSVDGYVGAPVMYANTYYNNGAVRIAPSVMAKSFSNSTSIVIGDQQTSGQINDANILLGFNAASALNSGITSQAAMNIVIGREAAWSSVVTGVKNIIIGTYQGSALWFPLDTNASYKLLIGNINGGGGGTLISGDMLQGSMWVNPTAANSNTPDTSVAFGINSTIVGIGSSTAHKGFLPPRMTSANRLSISTPAVGLIVYETGSAATEGLWLNESTGWHQLLTNTGSQSISGSLGINNSSPSSSLDVSGSGRFTNGLTVTGSININAPINYITSSIVENTILTTNTNKPILTTYLGRDGIEDHIYIGSKHLFWTGSTTSATTQQLIAIGASALEKAGIDGNSRNAVGIGLAALGNLRTGIYNTAVGVWGLEYLENGQRNTSIGEDAGGGFKTGSFNTFLGAEAGYSNNQTANQNSIIAIGYRALYTASTPVPISNTTIIGNQLNTSLSNVFLLGRSDQNVIIGHQANSTLGSDFGYKLHVIGSGNYTNGLTVTGSLNVSQLINLTPQNPLPSGIPTGSFAVSGSGVDCKPYFWNGSTWTSLF
jgi:hypothetical protein